MFLTIVQRNGFIVLIVWCLMPISTYFCYIVRAILTCNYLSRSFFLPAPHNILSSHWLLSHLTIIERMVSGGRGMNSVAMTIINAGQEIVQIDQFQARDQTRDFPFSSPLCQTELQGSALSLNRKAILPLTISLYRRRWVL